MGNCIPHHKKEKVKKQLDLIEIFYNHYRIINVLRFAKLRYVLVYS